MRMHALYKGDAAVFRRNPTARVVVLGALLNQDLKW